MFHYALFLTFAFILLVQPRALGRAGPLLGVESDVVCPAVGE